MLQIEAATEPGIEMRPILIGFLAAVALPAHADCPPVPDRSSDLATLFDAARAAPDESAGRALSNRMWEIWTEAPDEAAQALLDRGMASRQVGDLLGALGAFDKLVDYCPHYAEGHNQRAFIHFLNGDMERALQDLDRVLEIMPVHVGALSGRALALIELGRTDEAQDTLRTALALNPGFRNAAC